MSQEDLEGAVHGKGDWTREGAEEVEEVVEERRPEPARKVNGEEGDCDVGGLKNVVFGGAEGGGVGWFPDGGYFVVLLEVKEEEGGERSSQTV